jgi:sulfonate transport system permease protein
MTSSAEGASNELTREPRPTHVVGAPLAPRLRSLIVPVALLVLWEIAVRTGATDSRYLPTLEAIAVRGVKEFGQKGLSADLAASLARDLLGFVVGASSGAALGLALGFSRVIERLLGPLLLAHRQIALFAWVPLISMWFGGGEAGKVVFIALAAFQPTLMNTWQGVAGIPNMYRELSRVLTFNGWDFAVVIALPGSLPRIFTGLHAA